MAALGELPDVEISDKGVKVSPLDNCVPAQVSPLAEPVYSMLPRPKITEVLDEVNSWTTFTRHFSHIKNDITRPDTRLLLTTILADGINLGLTKMAEACPGSTKSSLEDIQAWYIRGETYSAALAELVNAQGKYHWRHSGETEQRHHQMDRISEQAAQAATQGRLTRNMGKSLDVSFIPIFRINTAHFTPA